MPITALPTADDLGLPSAEPDDSSLARELTLFDALAVNAGIMLSAVVFVAPAFVLASVGTGWLSTAAWATAGAISWCGAVSLAELGVLFPRSGGLYVYLARAYSQFWGFLYGWTTVAVIQSASIAAVAVASLTYLGPFWSLGPRATTGGAVGLILALSAWNASDIRLSLSGQRAVAGAKVALLTLVAIGCVWYGGAGAETFRALAPRAPVSRTVAGFAAAVTIALWGLSGWTSLTLVGGEIRRPERTLPRAMSFSVIGMTALALAMTTGFLWAIPLDVAIGSNQIGVEAAARVFDRLGGGLLTLTIVVSCVAAVNGLLFTGGRLIYAMARDGLFPTGLGAASRRKVPARAILFQGLWAGILTLTGRFDQLFTAVVVAVWLFSMLGAYAVVVLRHRLPNRPRPYQVAGYPYAPVLFGTVAWALLLHTLWSSPGDAAIGLVVMLAGVPAYWYWSRRVDSAP